MKVKLFIPPVIALVIVAIWMSREPGSIPLLEYERTVLRSALVARSSGWGLDAAPLKSKSSDRLPKENGPTDWKKMATQVSELLSTGSLADAESITRLIEKYRALSREELSSALDEIATLDLPHKPRQRLQILLLIPLREKDPEYALTHYFSLMENHNTQMTWQMGRAMAGWAGKNPTAATAWFDQQIAAGKFDSKSLDGKREVRLQFEGSLIVGLISSDPAAAASRLKSLPEDQRAASLKSTEYTIKDEEQLAYANLIRNGLPETAQIEAFKRQIDIGLREKVYTEITEYLDRIKATPAERTICVEQAAKSKIEEVSFWGKVTRRDFDAMREWVTSQAPGTTDKVTGVVLAEVLARRKFSAAAGIATQYNEAAGNDEVLIGFLMAYNPNGGSKEEARVLAQKITDVKKREEILSRFK
jgi:hypothetical protein